ncbi:BTAD domain-containing putative transcriptional regulator [Actinopolymorpha sp. NPDC004070]|uniref:AfsR/SARP family transcriptional regulator n=1 Tax=Actinopolymorpha sp. NPDC004070 TaxID=3154548 RepID=UPI0033AFF5B0
MLTALVVGRGQPLSIDSLIEEVWPDGPPRGAVNQIHGYAVRLRRLLADPHGRLLRTSQPGYELRLDVGDVDVDRFEDLLRRGEDALRGHDFESARDFLGAGLELWHGAPFADVPMTLKLQAEVDRLEERRMTATEARIEADLALGREAGLVAELRTLTANSPYREGLWRQLMLALYRTGRQADALTAYQELRRRLDEDLGVEPTPALSDLHQRILRAEAGLDLPRDTPAPPNAPVPAGATVQAGTSPAEATDQLDRATNQLDRTTDQPGRAAEQPEPASSPNSPSFLVPHQLPADLPDFTGREEELRALDALIGLPDAPPATSPVLVAVDGAGGIGKTTLALHWAHSVAHRFPDGQVHIDLHGYHPDAPLPTDAALDHLLRSLGVDGDSVPRGVEARAALLRSVLSGRRVLLILDNARSAEQVRPLLPGTPGCFVLATSRDDLAGLVARNGARRLTLDRFSPATAHDLLRSILGPRRVDDEPEAALAIGEYCGGFPLGLRIAAERVARRRSLSLADVAAEFADPSRRLDALDVPRDPTAAVREVFSWSYRALSPEAARAFRLLGLGPSPEFPTAAAAAALGTSRTTALRLLDELAGCHLIEPVHVERWRAHDLLHAYAREVLTAEEPPQERDNALRRLLDWILRTADAAVRMLDPARRHLELPPAQFAVEPQTFTGYAQALDWCDLEGSAFLPLIRIAADSGEATTAWQLAAAVWSYYYLRGRAAEWVAAERVALDAARRSHDDSGEAWTLNRLGVAHRERGDLDEARACFQASVEVRRRTSDRFGEASSLDNLGSVFRMLSRHGDAIDCRQRAIEIQREIGDRIGEAGTLSNLALSYLDMGQLDEAFDALQRALEIQHVEGDEYGLAETYAGLGTAHLQTGDPHTAAEQLRRSLDLYRRRDDQPGAARALTRLGDALHASGEHEAARDCWRDALAAHARCGNSAESEVQARLAASAADLAHLS